MAMSTCKKTLEASYKEEYDLWRKVMERTVLLTENYCTKDKDLAEMLERLRVGKVTESDLAKLRKRTFGHPEGPKASDPRWQSAVLITTRNVIRQAWNNQAAFRHSMKTNNQIYICPSLDKGIQCRRTDMIWTSDSKTEFLATWAVLSIESPTVVTANIAVELRIANGTQVTIKAVIRHPSEMERVESTLFPSGNQK